MSSSCFSGGRTYGFDREIVKSPSTSTRTSQTSSSPSSTLSESSNSRLAICTRKPRTPRKRPNQTYNEAAALLSTAYPTIFSTKHLIKKPQKLTTRIHEPFSDQSSDILLPFRVIDSPGFLLHQPIQEQRDFQIDHRPSNCYEKPCLSPAEIDSQASRATASSNLELCESFEDDFDTESILDEEIEEGIIDSIMGMSTDPAAAGSGGEMQQISNSWYGNPIGLGFGGKFDFGFGLRRGVRPLRHVDEGSWWCSPTVDVLEISPRLNKPSTPPPPPPAADKKKKKRPSATAKAAETKESESPQESSITDKPNPAGQPLLLKLNYEEVVKEWSDRGLPFPEELADSPENNVYGRLAEIDLFAEGGGLREASVMRYKEKRRTRLFSKKIRYQVRKVNADRRPRMKGRFVRRPNSISSSSSQR